MNCLRTLIITAGCLKCKSSERMKLLNKLNSNNVMARPVWGLCHKQRYTKQFQSFEIEKSKTFKVNMLTIISG